MIDTLIMAGRYREALELPAAWSDSAREVGARAEHQAYALACVNRVEAAYNLGRLDVAQVMIAELGSVRLDGDAKVAFELQRAWLAVLCGSPERALASLEGVRVALPAYRAELCYARGFALSALGRHAAARSEAQRGLGVALRASSVRNGLYLCAAIAHAADDPTRALRWYEAGFEHPYRAQGGAALVSFGELLAGRGDRARAELAYISALDRDPQSHACDTARARLAQLRAAV
jgi:tetratricopeptide (TPR) repeat protein